MTQTVCKTIEGMEMCIRNPSMVPTFEFRLRAIDLPLDLQDQAYLGQQIRVFAPEQSVLGNAAQVAGRAIQSKNMEQPEFQLPADFLALGVCALAYVEPYGMTIDGNLLTTQAQAQALASAPLSPDVILEAGAVGHGNVIATQLAALTDMCPAHLDWGHSTWKFADWFFKAYRMSVQCQAQSNVHEVLNERLVDMGNCCLDTNKEGFSTTAGSWIEAVFQANNRLLAIENSNLRPAAIANAGVAAPANMGLFYPLNAKTTYDQVHRALGASIVYDPMRYNPQIQAFGGLGACGAHKWFKFDVPRIIKAHRNIKITLESLNEDLPNWIRMIREASYRGCATLDQSGKTCGSGTNRVIVGDLSSYTAYARQCMARIPAGRVQIGIGLKGLLLDKSLCGDVEDYFSNLTPEAAAQAFNWVGGGSVGPLNLGGAGCAGGTCGG